jgi:hypothetical protein
MRRVPAGLLLVAGLLGVLPGGIASAAPGDGSAARATFGVRPTETRPTFAYAATPGGVLTDRVEVSNAGTAPLTLRVYASDAFNPRAGGFDLLPAGGKPTDVGAWVAMSRTTVQVPARGKVLVPFTMRIPAGATPGDHTGGIVASLSSVRSDAKGDRVAVDQRVGARIYLRISGALQPALTVEGLTARFHPTLNPFGSSRTTLTYRVRNTGNVRLGARQRVTVGTLWGTDRDAPGVVDLPEILPGNAVDVTTEVHSALPAIWLTSAVRAEPLAQPGDQALAMTATTRERGFWAVSWTLLALVALAAGVVVLGWRRARRRQRVTGTPAPVVDHALA